MPRHVIKPAFMLNGAFSSWRRLNDCTPPAAEECRRFWWAIESAPWKRVSAEASARERMEATQRKTDEAILPVTTFAEAAAGTPLADWE
jgi:hypothetical protein